MLSLAPVKKSYAFTYKINITFLLFLCCGKGYPNSNAKLVFIDVLHYIERIAALEKVDTKGRKRLEVVSLLLLPVALEERGVAPNREGYWQRPEDNPSDSTKKEKLLWQNI